MSRRLIEKILVPVDFSPCSRGALDYAVTLCARFGASADILHVWEPATELEADAQLLSVFARSEAGREMARVLTLLESSGLDRVRGRVECGAAATRILKVAEAERYDLIIMGTHGQTRRPHLLRGSVAESVVRRARCPVLTIRQEDASWLLRGAWYRMLEISQQEKLS